mmetsp:Transcript_14453/g.16035  ORF Transcript_14453/g.16035 Transcript_14453/m.16035 type:complete len:573 (+) Transcript_14453:45-1763(+)
MSRVLITLLLVGVIAVTVQCKEDYCQSDADCVADNRFPNARFCMRDCDSNDVESACFDGPVGDCCGCTKDGNLWRCAGCVPGQRCTSGGGCESVPPTTLPPTRPASSTIKFKLSSVTLSDNLESEIIAGLATYLSVPEDTFTNFRAVQVGDDVIIDLDILNSAGGMTPSDIATSIKDSFADPMSVLLTQATADMSTLASVDTAFPVEASIPPPALSVALNFPMTMLGDGTGDTITKADFENGLKSEIAVALGLDPDTITNVVATQDGENVRVDFEIDSPSGTFGSTSEIVDQLTADIQDPNSELIKNSANAGSVFKFVGKDGPQTGVLPEPTDVAFRLSNVTLGDGTGGTVTEEEIKMKVIDELVAGVPLDREDIENIELIDDGDGVKVVVFLPADEATNLNDALVNPSSKLNTDAKANPDSALGDLDPDFVPVVNTPEPTEDVTFRISDTTGLTDNDIKMKLPDEIATGLGIDPSTIANVRVEPDGDGALVTFTITQPSGTFNSNEEIADKIITELQDPNSDLLTGAQGGSVLSKTDTDYSPPTPEPSSGATNFNFLFVAAIALFAIILLH